MRVFSSAVAPLMALKLLPCSCSVNNSWLCLSPLPRIVRLVLVLRDWANKSLHEEQQRPDPFLERFQGPELLTVPAGTGGELEDEETEKLNKK